MLSIDSGELPWRDSPSEGVSWKKIHFDKASGNSVVLLRFEAGAEYAAHAHPKGEEYWIISGELQEGSKLYGAGTYVIHPPGSKHKPKSPSGCVVLVRLAAPIEAL